MLCSFIFSVVYLLVKIFLFSSKKTEWPTLEARSSIMNSTRRSTLFEISLRQNAYTWLANRVDGWGFVRPMVGHWLRAKRMGLVWTHLVTHWNNIFQLFITITQPVKVNHHMFLFLEERKPYDQSSREIYKSINSAFGLKIDLFHPSLD